MPVERQRWIPAQAWDALNARLRRVVEVLDISARVAVLEAASSTTLPLTYPQTLVEADTAAGAVVLTLPAAAQHPGFRVEVVKTGGANALTVAGDTVTSYASWVSTGAAWRRVG